MEHKLRINMLYVHEKQQQSNLFDHILKAHPKCEVQIIKANTHAWKSQYGNVSGSYKDHFREKHRKAALLHRTAKWKPDPNGNSTDFLPGLMMTQGCGFGCTYCYTERHYTNNYPKLYSDVYNVVAMVQQTIEQLPQWRQKMMDVTGRDFEMHRDIRHGDWVTFDLGCDSDCVLDNQMTAHEHYPGHVVDIMNQISLIPGAMTSFATKSAAFDNFIKHVERPSHHRIRLSLMPESHRTTLEITTSSILDRLDAVNRLVDAGFQVHLNLSPIVVTEEYSQEYPQLLQLINSKLSERAKSQLAYEIIFLTHTDGQFAMVDAYAPKAHTMMTHGPIPLVPKPNKKNVLSYSQKDKKYLKNQLRSWISEYTPYGRVRYCY